MNLNKVSLIGNLTADPQEKPGKSNIVVIWFGLATNQVKNKKQEVEFHSIVAFGKLGEVAMQYLHKGEKVYIEGRLKTSTWKDKQGILHARTEIIASNLIMLGNKAKAATGEQGK